MLDGGKRLRWATGLFLVGRKLVFAFKLVEVKNSNKMIHLSTL